MGGAVRVRTAGSEVSGKCPPDDLGNPWGIQKLFGILWGGSPNPCNFIELAAGGAIETQQVAK